MTLRAVANDEAARPDPDSTEWWLRRLSWKLDRRLGRVTYRRRIDDRVAWLPSIARWEAYYRGELNLMLSSAKWRQEFADRFPGYSANFMGLVVDKHRERLAVQGIRYADQPQADKDAWAWWQANHQDAEAPKLYREALVKGNAYVLVWPNEKGEPEASIETADEMIVECAPGKSWVRLAALKRWVNGDDGYAYAELYLPDRPEGKAALFKYRSVQRDSEFSLDTWTRFIAWEKWQPPTDTDWPLPIPIGVVPVVPFANRPGVGGEGESEIAAVASSQDAINKFRVDAVVASEYAAFRQRWAIGLDIPVDPATGEAVESFKASVDRLWIVPPATDETGEQLSAADAQPVTFGEFGITPLDPFYGAITGEVQMLGAISRTPYHYLLPQSGQPPSGDSLRAAEAGLVAKVEDSHLSFGEGHEEVFRLMFAWRNDPRAKITDAEVIWRPAETQSEAQHVDALVKLVTSLQVPVEAAWEQLPGVTQQTIRRWNRMIASAALRAAAATPTAPAAVPGAPAQPTEVLPAPAPVTTPNASTA